MTTFEGILSEKEIADIYFFIENESRLQNIERNEVEYVTECNITYRGNPDEPNGRDWGIDSIEVKTNQGNRSVSHHGHASSDQMNTEIEMPRLNIASFNIFWANDLGWTNIDYLIGRDDILSKKIESFEIKLNGAKDEGYTSVLLVLEKRNIVLGVYGLNSEGNFIFPESYQLKLPQEEARIIAINENYAYASKKIIIGDKNFHTLELQAKSKEEFFKFIENL